MTRTILLALLFTGCAHTTVYIDGKKALVVQADAENVTFRQGSTYFHADRLNHSTPTLAQGKAGTDKIGAIGTVAGALGLGSIFAR